jgi:uncharacterized repeat protein (TIGR04076 family)
MSRFPKCRITVLKKMYNPELAEEFRRPDVPKGPCPFFEVGQEFMVEYMAQRPADFECDWAWDDLHKIIMILMTRGNFGTWMKNENNFVACCTDGIKPVAFQLERIEAD